MANPDGSFEFSGDIEFLGFTSGKPVSDKVAPDSVEMNWTNKKMDVNCIMCNRKMTVKKFEYPPYYCYKCNEEAEAVFQDV